MQEQPQQHSDIDGEETTPDWLTKAIDEANAGSQPALEAAGPGNPLASVSEQAEQPSSDQPVEDEEEKNLPPPLDDIEEETESDPEITRESIQDIRTLAELEEVSQKFNQEDNELEAERSSLKGSGTLDSRIRMKNINTRQNAILELQEIIEEKRRQLEREENLEGDGPQDFEDVVAKTKDWIEKRFKQISPEGELTPEKSALVEIMTELFASMQATIQKHEFVLNYHRQEIESLKLQLLSGVPPDDKTAPEVLKTDSETVEQATPVQPAISSPPPAPQPPQNEQAITPPPWEVPADPEEPMPFAPSDKHTETSEAPHHKDEKGKGEGWGAKLGTNLAKIVTDLRFGRSEEGEQVSQAEKDLEPILNQMILTYKGGDLAQLQRARALQANGADLDVRFKAKIATMDRWADVLEDPTQMEALNIDQVRYDSVQATLNSVAAANGKPIEELTEIVINALRESDSKSLNTLAK